ncbi:MAG: universal stress protein [Nitrospirae bacterium]|nr:universal stress protein [Nitrospirota bacterium]
MIDQTPTKILTMGLYRKILVAFDGSESSVNALLQAFTLANDEKCWITVATVVPTYEGDLDLTGVKDIHETLRHTGEEVMSKAKAIAGKKRALIKTVLEEGIPYEKLADLAEAENYGIIIMGRRGKSRLERAFVGSVTARVIGHSTKDVLVVPETATICWKNILFATDGSTYSNAATDKAIAFAKSYGGEIKVISVVDVPTEFYAEAPKAVEDLIKKAKEFVAVVRQKAHESDIKATTFVGEGEAYSVITELAKKEKADVLVMGSHGRTGFSKIIMGSVTEKVIGYAPCPVLVVKA